MPAYWQPKKTVRKSGVVSAITPTRSPRFRPADGSARPETARLAQLTIGKARSSSPRDEKKLTPVSP